MTRSSSRSAVFEFPHGRFLAACAAAMALSAAFLDQPFAIWIREPGKARFRLFNSSITDGGLSILWFAFAALTFAFARWAAPRLVRGERWKERWRNLRDWGAHLFAALTVSGLILLVVKFSVGRERPHMTPAHDPLVFRPFDLNPHFESFPSGHTQTLFCVATLFGVLFPRGRWGFWLAAAALALTRVCILQHFISDVIGGMVVGVLGSELSLALLSRRVPYPKPWGSA